MASNDLPERLQRYPTRVAIDRLATRLGLPNDPGMEAWEWEVADVQRLDEFIALYGDSELSDDERFTLMETIIQSCEDLDDALEADPRWATVRRLLEKNLDLHISSVWFWAALDNEPSDVWEVSEVMRDLVKTYRRRFVAG